MSGKKPVTFEAPLIATSFTRPASLVNFSSKSTSSSCPKASTLMCSTSALARQGKGQFIYSFARILAKDDNVFFGPGPHKVPNNPASLIESAGRNQAFKPG